MICGLHGHLWRGDMIPYIMDKYDKWASTFPKRKVLYWPMDQCMVIRKMPLMPLLSNQAQKGIKDIRVYDVLKLILPILYRIFLNTVMWSLQPSLQYELYFLLDSLIRELAVLNISNRKVSLIGNHTWASAALKNMTEMISNMKNMEIVGTPIDIKSSLREDREGELDNLADAIYESMDD